MNPFYAPYQGKPPIVERWPECRPKIHNGAYELHRSGEYFDLPCPPEGSRVDS